MDPRSPAGWHPDPSGSPSLRYWDGAAWTDQVASPAAPPFVAPVDGNQPPARRPTRRRGWIIGGAVFGLSIVLVGGVLLAVHSNPAARRVLNGVLSGDNHFYIVSGASMSPALQQGDEIGSRSSYGILRRGDVVLLHPPGGGEIVIRRVVGLPGETVSASASGQLMINGAPLDEPYVATGSKTPGVSRLVIPAGSFYVLADNRSYTSDSRLYGPIPGSAVVALVDHIFTPPARAGGVPGEP